MSKSARAAAADDPRPRPLPNWLAEVSRLAAGPVPWGSMAVAALAIAVPLVVGVAAGHVMPAVLAALGAIVGALADPGGPYGLRFRRVTIAGVFGGTAGLLVGTAINGRGWVVVAVLVAVAGVSALLSGISATWSTTAMFLLVFTGVATGPLGTIRPWWQPPLWMLVGTGWTLLLLLPGWVLHPRAVEQHLVAAVYRTLATSLGALGTDRFATAWRDVTTALEVAYEALIIERAAATGRDQTLNRLVALLNQARLVAEASDGLAYTGERAPRHAAAQADAIAAAVTAGITVVPRTEPPPTGTPAARALQSALDGAAAVLDGAVAEASWPRDRRPPLLALTEHVRDGFVPTFALRLMLCIGVAAVLTEVLPLQRSYWVVVAVALVLKPDFGSVFARALQNAMGTVLGAGIAALILLANPSTVAMLAPVVVFAALLPYGMRRNYGLVTVFFTPLVIMVIELISPDGWRLAEARLVDNLLGCAVALSVGYLAWPSSWHINLPRDFADALDEAARYLDEALGGGDPDVAVTAHSRARKALAALRAEVQRVTAEPQGVRERALAWWPAHVALAWVLDAVTATAVSSRAPRPAATVRELSSALRRTAAAVRSGEAAGPATVSSPRSLDLVSDAVRSLQDGVAAAQARSHHPSPDRYTHLLDRVRWGTPPPVHAPPSGRGQH